jgi:beta-mannosidase
VERFIPNEYLWTARDEYFEGIDNPMWLYHAASEELTDSPYTYRIKLMSGQVNTLFGTSVPCTLDDFARASQISQAEAKKYFIERFRCAKGDKMGIIWWNLRDGWPQFSDAVVDYYGIKKLAYSYIKRSQAPVCLMCREPVGDELCVVAVNEFPTDKNVSYRITDLTDNKKIASGAAEISADMATNVCKITINPDEKHFYLIEWELDGEKHSNHYMTNIKDIDYSEYLGYIKKCGYDQFEGF